LQSAGVGLIADWHQGGHGGPDGATVTMFPELAYPLFGLQSDTGFNMFNFHKNQSYVAFKSFSLDNNPGTGSTSDGDARGMINRLPWYDRATIKDSVLHYEVELFLSNYTADTMATATVMPSRLQRLGHVPGTVFTWKNIRKSSGAVLDSGTVTADANGIIAIPAVTLLKSRSRLTVDFSSASAIGQKTGPDRKTFRNYFSAGNLNLALQQMNRTYPQSKIEVYGISGERISASNLKKFQRSGMYFITVNGKVMHRVVMIK